eukprot:TRINITY_DN2354_c0_g1_i1.p1 TRINITY_DN2354_c0_g1~~TRINITY_DN2354_c0_g1_i1.p1  ORF type:complete len:133 (-),score=45.32 TRINITY_DN2354_c0_g1_i1:144-542(-)
MCIRDRYKQWLCNTAKASTKYRFAWMDTVKHDTFLSSMSVTTDDIPVLVMLDSPAKLHFVHRNASLTREEFIAAVEAGEVVAQGDGASWWAYVKSQMLGICVVMFVAVIGFFIWLGDPNDAPATAPAAKKAD